MYVYVSFNAITFQTELIFADLAILFSLLVFLFPKTFKLIAFPIF